MSIYAAYCGILNSLPPDAVGRGASIAIMVLPDFF
jgi:hypothetical protein